MITKKKKNCEKINTTKSIRDISCVMHTIYFTT